MFKAETAVLGRSKCRQQVSHPHQSRNIVYDKDCSPICYFRRQKRNGLLQNIVLHSTDPASRLPVYLVVKPNTKKTLPNTVPREWRHQNITFCSSRGVPMELLWVDCSWLWLNLMDMNNFIIWSNPRMILQVPWVKWSLINPNESCLILNESSKETSIYMSIDHNIFSHWLYHSKFWFSKMILKIVF